MAQGMGDIIGDFANNGVLEGGEQPPAPTDDLNNPVDQDAPDGRGELLDLAKKDPQAAANKIKKLWELQDPANRRRKVIWDQHKLWMMGIRGIRARPVSTDVNRWELYVPPGALDMPPVLDQTESMLDKVTSHILADKASPYPIPVDDSPQERDGAQFAKRWLKVLGSEANANDALVFRTASKKSGIYGSTFIYHYVEDQGWDSDPTAPDGRRWRKTICKKQLPPFYVRPIPETARDVANADGLLVMDTRTVGDIKREFPESLDWSQEQWNTVVNWKPQASKWALPWYINQRMNKGPEFKEDGTPTDSSPIVTLALYMRSSSEYPDGCYILTAGGEETLYAEDWLDHSDEQAPRPLDIPISQVKQLTDDVADDFYGRALIAMLGPIGEVRSSIILAWLDYLDRFTHPHTFIPLGSVVQPDQLAARDGRGIFFNPQGQPTMEQVPPFPQDAKEFLDRAQGVEQDIVGLYAATGESQAGVRSADQLALQTSNAQMNTTQISDNMADAIKRSWRISLQLARAFIPEPQILRDEDEDGAYREQEWRGLDFGRTNQVEIEPGTFTQMSPEAREQRIIQWQQLQWITPDQAKALVGSGIKAEVGLEDNPFLRKVRRELSAWRKGPDAGWMQQAQQVSAQNAQIQSQAQLQPPPQPGQPPAQPPQPIPMPAGPFQRVATDMEPDAAAIRHAEIRREQSMATYGKMPKPWQVALDTEYEAMRQAAGILLTSESSQSQQAASKAQMDALTAQKVTEIQTKGQVDIQIAEIREKARAAADMVNAQFQEQAAEYRARLDITKQAIHAGHAQDQMLLKSQLPPVPPMTMPETPSVGSI